MTIMWFQSDAFLLSMSQLTGSVLTTVINKVDGRLICGSYTYYGEPRGAEFSVCGGGHFLLETKHQQTFPSACDEVTSEWLQTCRTADFCHVTFEKQ